MRKTWLLLITLLSCLSCADQFDRDIHFQLISPEASGVNFVNEIRESDSLNCFNFFYIYMGAGAGVGDFNNDGLPDLFFSGNSVSGRLYLNQGQFRFNDVTEEAGVLTDRWVTGVSVIDINNDGWQDLYLCVSGLAAPAQRKNLLYINNGAEQGKAPTFTEAAEAYGIADDGYATQAAFFDYDQDGDLDLYVMRHANEAAPFVELQIKRNDGSALSTDRLYQNIGTDSLGHPYYRDVSAQAGILMEGYGLGLSIADINQDNWPDIYVANDFVANDLLYINNQDGTFTDKLAAFTQQTSQNGMGADIADFNNDGLPDITVLDMLPETNLRQKTMTADMNYDYFSSSLQTGFSPQFIRNTLQLNRGMQPDGTMKFSEVGRLAGIHQTDWSWAPLWADFDNDGLRDLFITNGYMRDITNHDFQLYQNQILNARNERDNFQTVLQKISELDPVKIPNYLFQNQGNLQFEDQTKAWDMEQPSLSNGAAYADLDNDGDLDLIVNNINQPAFIYENQSRNHHYLRANLSGDAANRNAYGAKIKLTLPDGKEQYHEHYPVRGYQSTVEPTAHFGIGNHKQVTELIITWPDGKQTNYHNLAADSTYYFTYESQKAATLQASAPIGQNSSSLFKPLTEASGLTFQHQENSHIDYKLEPLLLQMYSRNGPGIAVGDNNGDGREDAYIGGARNQPGQLFYRQTDGSFQAFPLEQSEKFEDMGALFFDADQDGDQDLYVVSGGSAIKYFQKGDYQDRLYLNDGKGNLIQHPDALPQMDASGSCVIAADYDQDGDLDLFVGGRVYPGKFPTPPRSYLLNNQNGIFRDVTNQVANGLDTIGMVTSALWTDYDNDYDTDLIVVGELMPVTVIENQGGRLSINTSTSIQFTENEQSTALNHTQSSGWWNSIIGGDFDRDGDTDYVLGNNGNNTAYKATLREPIRIYAKDFDQNTSLDAIASRFVQGTEYPIAPRDAMIGQMNFIRRAFPRYNQYGNAEMKALLSYLNLEDAILLNGYQLSSCYLENKGNNAFNMKPLPIEAQFAPIFGMLTDDFNKDQYLDILFVGNSQSTEIINGWCDASYGGLLLGDGTGNFEFTENRNTGWWVAGDAKALVRLQSNSPVFLASINNDTLQTYQKAHQEDTHTIFPEPGDMWAEVVWKDGSTQKYEFYQGAGYLSQSSSAFSVNKNHVASIKIFDFKGNARTIAVNL